MTFMHLHGCKEGAENGTMKICSGSPPVKLSTLAEKCTATHFLTEGSAGNITAFSSQSALANHHNKIGLLML